MSLFLTDILNQLEMDPKYKITRTTKETNTQTPISNRLWKSKNPDMENSNADHSLAQKRVIPLPKKKKIEAHSLPKLSTAFQQKQQSGHVKIPLENKVLSSKKYSPKYNTSKTKQKPGSPTSLSKCLEASKPKHPEKVNKMGVENKEEGKRNELHKRNKPDVEISKLDHWLIQKGVISPLPNKKINACSLPILSTTTEITEGEKFVKNIEKTNTERRIHKRRISNSENSNAQIPPSPIKKEFDTQTYLRVSTIMQQKLYSQRVKTPVENIVQNNVVPIKKYSPKRTTKNKQISLSKCLETSKPKHPKKDNKTKVQNEEEGKRNKLHTTKELYVRISRLNQQLTPKGLPHNEKIGDCSSSKLFINMQEKQSEPVKTRVRNNLVTNKVMSNKKYSPKRNTTKNKHKSVSPKASKTTQPRKVGKLVTEKKKTSNKMCPPKSKGKEKNQSTLNLFQAKNNTKTLKRNDSSESIALPTFSNVTKKKSLKSSKLKQRKTYFQKYGVTLPTIEEIIMEKKDLENYRKKIESFKPVCDDSLKLPFIKEILLKPAKGKVLDCKHLTLDQLTSAFNLNASFLSDIINEKISNNRHQRYFDKNLNVLSMTSDDLTYNTSTIVFSYEQIYHLMSLLKKQFDPTSTKTKYFFQVLLPELCLQIFMKTYKMNLEQAMKYLDERPIMD